MRRQPQRARRAFTLLELVIAASIGSVLLLAVTVAVHREAEDLAALATRTAAESRAIEMVERLEDSLEFAQGAAPVAWLNGELGAGEASATVDTTRAFPDRGLLLLQPGTAAEERLAYGALDAAGGRFLQLERGQQCTTPAIHADSTRVLWAAVAEAIEDQVAPPAAFFDGISLELSGPVFFRGDGTGFSFRVPTDPGGGTDFFDADGVRWGATVEGTPTEDGWSCVTFEEVAVVTEAARGLDVNRDGDLDDTFDLGRVRHRSWDAATPGRATDVALCPPMVVQERCNWGGDLDADGFDDPIFLWDGTTGRLRLRLFVLAGADGSSTVRRLESVLFLRNGAMP